ncbi:MAG: hypothetical protein KDA83_02975 [Planctomycetales bacterium]|nr:hypothetical protein [Planctomycetales bacterium]
MNGLAVALVIAVSGVETTWETRPEGDQVYVIQLDEQAIEALRAGYPITSIIPQGVNPVGAVRLQYGEQRLQKPAIAASGDADSGVAQVSNVASLAFLQQVPSSSPPASSPNTFSPAEAFQRQQQPQAFAPNSVDRGVPLRPTLADSSPLAGVGNAPADGNIRINPEALQWDAFNRLMDAPLMQGMPYATGSYQANNPPARLPPTQLPPAQLASPLGSNVGASDWDAGRNVGGADPNSNLPRTSLWPVNQTNPNGAGNTWQSVNQPTTPQPGPSYQSPLAGTNTGATGGQATGSPQWPVTGQGQGSGYSTSGWNGGSYQPGLMAPPNLPANNPGYYASTQGQTNPVPYAPGQGTGTTTGAGYPMSGSGSSLPAVTKPQIPDWVNSQGPLASANAGQQLAGTIRPTSYTSSGVGTSLNSTRPTTSNTSNTSGSTLNPNGPTEVETEPPKDVSVLALGLLFLSIGLNVYFGYLIRGFYLKTRQLARDLRESVLTA